MRLYPLAAIAGLIVMTQPVESAALSVGFEADTAGAKPTSVTAVRPITNVGTTDPLPISNTNPGPIGAVVGPYTGAPSLPTPGTGKFVRLYDYHTGSGAGLEWDFVTDLPSQAVAVKASLRFAATRPLSGGGSVRLSIGRYTGGTALSLNSGTNRPFLVTFSNDGALRLELSATGPQATTFDTALAHTLTIVANDHETDPLAYTGPDDAVHTLPPNSVAVFLNAALVGSGPFDAATAAVFGTDANLGRIGMSTLTSDGNIDFVFDDVTVEILEAGGGGPVPPGPVVGFGRGTGDPSVVELDPDVLMSEPFDYADGALEEVGGRWRVQDGAPRLTIESGSLRYDYLAGSAIGNATRNFAGSRTVLRAPATGGIGPVVYHALTLRVDTAPTSTSGNAVLGYQSSTSATTIRGTLWVRAGSAPGTFQVGIGSENALASATYLETDLAPDTAYRLAVRFDLTTNGAALWLDPADAAAEPVLTIPGSGTLLTGASGIVARINTGSNLGRFRIDDLRAALSLGGALGTGPVAEPAAEMVRDSAGISVLGDGFDAYFSGNAMLGMLRAANEYWVSSEGGQWVVPQGKPSYLLEDSRVIGSYHGRMQSHGELVTIHPSAGRLTLILQNNRTDTAMAYRVPLYLPHLAGAVRADGTALELPATASGAAVADIVFTSVGGRPLRALGFERLAPGAIEGSQDLMVDVPARGVRTVVLSFEQLGVDQPRDWQVVQRAERAGGPVVVRGRAPAGTAAVTVEFRAAAGHGGLLAPPLVGALPEGEHPVAMVGSGGAFAASLYLPAGGWYEAVVRARDELGAVLATRTIAPFGVGEVLLGAGQSNSTNSGTTRQVPTSGLVAAYSGGHWQVGTDPMPGNHDTTTKGSYYPPLGDLLAARLRVPIAFASTGHGGTSSAQWQKDAAHSFTDFNVSIRQGLYSWTQHRIVQLGTDGFRAMLWHQGESDSTHVPGTIRTPEQTYYDRMRALIEGQQADAGAAHDWYVARASRWPLETDGDPQIQNAVARLWADGIARRGADTDALGLEWREPAVDETSSRVHFNDAGLKEHAALWAVLLGDDLDAEFQGVGALDSDGSGAPDYWERLHGFDPADPADDLLDSDGDGFSNAQEFVLGTNPHVRDAWRLDVGAAAAGTTLTFQFTAIPGRIYVVQHRFTLAVDTPWQDLSGGLFVVDPGPLSYEVDLGAAPHGFFRVKVLVE